MGTDIHFYVERREGDKWVSCDIWEFDEWHDEEEGPAQLTVRYGKHFYDGCSYDTFAILADVRNGYGFAGVDTGDGFVPIAAPRGLPDDLSPQLKMEADRFLDHTPSWLLVSEIMAYDWTRVTHKRGVVNGPQYWKWARWDKVHGFGPEAYCGGISGPSIVHITAEQMQHNLDALLSEIDGLPFKEKERRIEEKLGNFYCQVTWQAPYYRCASSFLSETLPKLWRLGAPEDVRIVFWFDS